MPRGYGIWRYPHEPRKLEIGRAVFNWVHAPGCCAHASVAGNTAARGGLGPDAIDGGPWNLLISRLRCDSRGGKMDEFVSNATRYLKAADEYFELARIAPTPFV